MKGETRDRILTTAHGLMAQRGYSAFSYADISDAVQITKASIHFHFPTKAALAVAVLKAHRERLIAATEHLDGAIAEPLGRLRAYVQHWEACIRDKSMPFCVAALLAAELPSLPEEVEVEVRLHFVTLQQWLERTLKDAARRKTARLGATAAVEAELLMATVHGAMLSARAAGAGNVFKEITGAALKRLAV